MSSRAFSRSGWFCVGMLFALVCGVAVADRGVNENCESWSHDLADASSGCTEEKKQDEKKREVSAMTESVSSSSASATGAWNNAPTLNHFGAGFLAGLEENGGQSYSAQVSWFPEWRFYEPFFLRGGVHFSMQKIRDPLVIPVLSGNVSLFYQYEKFEVGGGPGAQTFFDNGGTKFELNGTLGYRIDEHFLVDIERFYATYTAYFAKNTIHQIVLGVGIAF